MKRMLAVAAVMVMTATLMAAGPEDGVKEAGAGWRQGAIKQDKALLEKYLADDLVYTHGGGQAEPAGDLLQAGPPLWCWPDGHLVLLLYCGEGL